MKKKDIDSQLFSPTNTSTKDFGIDKTKTTDVNILLNRVRLDQKKTLTKRIVFSIILACSVCLLAVYFII